MSRLIPENPNPSNKSASSASVPGLRGWNALVQPHVDRCRPKLINFALIRRVAHFNYSTATAVQNRACKRDLDQDLLGAGEQGFDFLEMAQDAEGLDALLVAVR